MVQNKICVVAAIAGVTVLGVVAQLRGCDGVMLALEVAAISGLGGFLLPSPLRRKADKND